MNKIIENILGRETLVFFDPKDGITSSHANHVANMCKELAATSLSTINGFSHVTERVSEDNKEYIVKKASSVGLLNEETFLTPGRYFSLSAWLREAVKRREHGLYMLSGLAVDDVDFDQQRPKMDETLLKPFFNTVSPDYIDIDSTEVLPRLFNVKELAEYYAAEAEAAHLSKLIHEHSNLSKMRDDILQFNELELRRFGNKELFVERSTGITIGQINNLYFALQKKYRDLQKRLNGYKSRLKDYINKYNAEENIRVQKINEDLKLKFDRESEAYQKALDNHRDLTRKWEQDTLQSISDAREEFASYKIIIPADLRDIYQQVEAQI